jgi:cytoskeletal protein CcmA (bactofilin family)
MSPPSLIPPGAALRGRLTIASDLLVEGEVSGALTVGGDLTIAVGGRVAGPLRARTVSVSGEVRGPVQGDERIEITRGGRVAGDLRAACVVLAEGSDLEGRIEIEPPA